MMTQMADLGTRLTIQMVLLPILAVFVPLLFALAWLREACSDLIARD